jgi:hypothetical protein
MNYVIKDKNGNYATHRSFVPADSTWLYKYYTGDCDGMRYYSKELAEKVLKELQNENILHNGNQIFSVVEIEEWLPLGNMVTMELQ